MNHSKCIELKISVEEIIENIIDNKDLLEGNTQLFKHLTHAMDNLKSHFENNKAKSPR